VRRFIKIVLVAVLLLACAAGYFGWKALPKIPDEPFVTPDGEFGVGTREYQWTDSSRAELYTKDPADRRTIVVQVWYPIARGTVGQAAKYLQHPKEFASRLGAWAARKATTHSIVDAPVAREGPFPVILYNHGGAWTRWSATFATEWLASHGYVVVSIEHFGFNQTTRFLDGSSFKADTLEFPKETGDLEKDALTSWDHLDDPIFKIWTADARFALDQVTRLNQESGPLAGAFDLDRVGAFGWSFGGATAVQLAADDDRVKAVVDQDGQLFGDVRQRGTNRPVLLLHHGADDAESVKEEDRPLVRKMLALVASWDSSARAASTGDWYEATIAGTDHGNFSDLMLFYRTREGRIDPRRAHQLINRYTLEFFDRYLKGKPSALLSGEEPPPDGVTFVARPVEAPDSTVSR